jgi:hypothetical protein
MTSNNHCLKRADCWKYMTYKIRIVGNKRPNTKHKTQNTKYKIRNSKFETQITNERGSYERSRHRQRSKNTSGQF